MPLLDWLRPRREAPARRPATTPAQAPPKPATSAAAPAAPVERLHLEARTLVAAWRPAEGLLSLGATAPVGRGRRVAIAVVGMADALEVTGAVHAVAPARNGHAVEILVDEDRRALLDRVVAAHRGDGAPLRQRATRYRVALPVVVSGPAGAAFMTVTSLSAGGCGVAWSGPAPRLGGGLHLRLGGGVKAVPIRAVVCWAREAPRGLRVGLRFVAPGDPQGQAALEALVAEARRGAAPA